MLKFEKEREVVTTREVISVAKRKVEAETTKKLQGEDSNTLKLLHNVTGLQRNPVTFARNQLGRQREMLYNRLRMNRPFPEHSSPVGEQTCAACGEQTAGRNTEHLYKCGKLKFIRGNLSLETLHKNPREHALFLQQINASCGGDGPCSESSC
jgi:hypothetical protein